MTHSDNGKPKEYIHLEDIEYERNFILDFLIYNLNNNPLFNENIEEIYRSKVYEFLRYNELRNDPKFYGFPKSQSIISLVRESILEEGKDENENNKDK